MPDDTMLLHNLQHMLHRIDKHFVLAVEGRGFVPD